MHQPYQGCSLMDIQPAACHRPNGLREQDHTLYDANKKKVNTTYIETEVECTLSGAAGNGMCLEMVWKWTVVVFAQQYNDALCQ